MGRDYFRLARTFFFFLLFFTWGNPRGHTAALPGSEESFREIFLSQSVARSRLINFRVKRVPARLLEMREKR